MIIQENVDSPMIDKDDKFKHMLRRNDESFSSQKSSRFEKNTF